MIAAMKGNRNSIGLEIDSAYCRMAANRLRDENQNLFSSAHIEFLRQEESRREGLVLKEDKENYLVIEKRDDVVPRNLAPTPRGSHRGNEA